MSQFSCVRERPEILFFLRRPGAARNFYFCSILAGYNYTMPLASKLLAACEYLNPVVFIITTFLCVSLCLCTDVHTTNACVDCVVIVG